MVWQETRRPWLPFALALHLKHQKCFDQVWVGGADGINLMSLLFWDADKRKPYVPASYSLRKPCRSPNCASNGSGCVWKYGSPKSHGHHCFSEIAILGSFGQSQVQLEFLGCYRTPRTSVRKMQVCRDHPTSKLRSAALMLQILHV